MKVDMDNVSFHAFLQHDDEYWDYEFMDLNLDNSYIVTYDEDSQEWYGIKEVLVEESFVDAGSLSEEQVNHCRELIPPVYLPKVEE